MVRFKDPIDPSKISIDRKMKGHNIKKDVTSMQANVTIGELFHDNPCLIQFAAQAVWNQQGCTQLSLIQSHRRAYGDE
jgi:hypothetical protein